MPAATIGGWPTTDMVIANMELSQRLAAGGFSGCGYGVVPDNLPFVTLVGDNLRGMKSALALLKEWTTLSGTERHSLRDCL